MSEQANRTVLITGTSSGVGEAFAVLAKTIPKRISRSIARTLTKRTY
ncbi:MAG: hypothetical protein H8E74_01480 [Gammaproteobacteria bacterium]|nr:hypothetical protein [Gammaproteobacteria bacterium]